jgi:hypothetical protein
VISTTIQSVPTESIGPCSLNPDNTNFSNNPGSPTTLVNSQEGERIPAEIGRVSIETQAPNPLSKLIQVYSDDENPEPSHGSPVHVQEEECHEKTASPKPEAQDK